MYLNSEGQFMHQLLNQPWLEKSFDWNSVGESQGRHKALSPGHRGGTPPQPHTSCQACAWATTQKPVAEMKSSYGNQWENFHGIGDKNQAKKGT